MKALHIVPIVLGTTTLIAHAQLRPSRPQFSVPLAAVARTVITTLATRGIQISIDQVKLPLDVLANEESPELEVSAVEKLGRLSLAQPGQTSASIKLKCRSANACRPFFAIATWQKEQEEQQAPVAVAKSPAVMAKVREPQAAPFIIKAGQPLTLFMDADHARIQIAVISTGSASLGQKIRVSTPDHKHFYMAEVLDAGTVKGSF